MPTPTTYMVISPPKLFDDFPMVSSLIDRDTIRWKADIVRSIFIPFEANTILNIPLSYNMPEDKIIRVGNRKGEFTVKSGYYIALKVRQRIREKVSLGIVAMIFEKGCGILKSPQRQKSLHGKHVWMDLRQSLIP